MQAVPLGNDNGTRVVVTLSGTVSAGDVVVDGDLIGVYLEGGDSGDKVTVQYGGEIWYVAKESGVAWSKGDQVAWNDSSNYATKTMTAGKWLGVVKADAASGDTFGYVYVNRIGIGKQAAVVAALTVSDGTGTNDGTIGAITGDASVIAAVQELAAKVNAILSALKAAGLMANS